jgi:HSP20 family protein
MESVWSGIGGGEDQPWIPAVDVEETDDAWIVEAEVPGVGRDDVNVELRDSELVISGETKKRERSGILRRAPGGPAGSSTASSCPVSRSPTPSKQRSTTAC